MISVKLVIESLLLAPQAHDFRSGKALHILRKRQHSFLNGAMQEVHLLKVQPDQTLAKKMF